MDPARKRRIRMIVALSCAVMLVGALAYTSFSAASTAVQPSQLLASTNPDIKRMLGKEGDFGKGIGLDNDWVVRIIKGVGNYGESYERNVGTGSRLKIARGLNNLWNNGGLQYAPPIR